MAMWLGCRRCGIVQRRPRHCERSNSGGLETQDTRPEGSCAKPSRDQSREFVVLNSTLRTDRYHNRVNQRRSAMAYEGFTIGIEYDAISQRRRQQRTLEIGLGKYLRQPRPLRLCERRRHARAHLGLESGPLTTRRHASGAAPQHGPPTGCRKLTGLLGQPQQTFAIGHRYEQVNLRRRRPRFHMLHFHLRNSLRKSYQRAAAN